MFKNEFTELEGGQWIKKIEADDKAESKNNFLNFSPFVVKKWP